MTIFLPLEKFLSAFEVYKIAFLPIQILVYKITILAVVVLVPGIKLYSRIVSAILAFLWLHVGIFYHLIQFRSVHPATWIPGISFIFQGALLFLVGTIYANLDFQFTMKPLPVVGVLFILYDIIIYPLLSIPLDYTCSALPLFGTPPCPVTIFTFGIFLFTQKHFPTYLLIIPLLLATMAIHPIINTQIPHEYGLFITGVLGAILIFIENRRIDKLAKKDSNASFKKA